MHTTAQFLLEAHCTACALGLGDSFGRWLQWQRMPSTSARLLTEHRNAHNDHSNHALMFRMLHSHISAAELCTALQGAQCLVQRQLFAVASNLGKPPMPVQQHKRCRPLQQIWHCAHVLQLLLQD